MLRDKNDIINLDKLIASLKTWSIDSNNVFAHENFKKETGTLNRFGWFYINTYKYSISGWQFKTGIITFENEINGEKIKFDITASKVIKNKFIKDSKIEMYKKNIRTKLSNWFGEISDKLRP
jgi:hypothetical protein